jgi:hypothetical protein
MRDDKVRAWGDQQMRKPMRRRVPSGLVQDRIIVTAERKKADLKSKENEYDACARSEVWEEKEGTDLA